LLRQTGLLDELVEAQVARASAPELADVAREDAIDALARCGATEALARLAESPTLGARLRSYVLSELSHGEKSKNNGNRDKNDEEDAGERGAEARNEAELRLAIVDPGLSMRARQRAALALTEMLTPAQIEATAASIADWESREDHPSDGVGVALALIKSLPRPECRGQVAAIAANAVYHPWIRAIAAQVVGTFFDPRRAIELLDGIALSSQSDPVLAQSIAHARESYASKLELNEETSDQVNPVVDEAYRAFLDAAADEAGIAKLAEDYDFVTDPEFIEQMEYHVQYKARTEEEPPLRRKLELLRALPPNLLQVSFRAFARARSLAEMMDATVRFPYLTTPDALARIDRTVRDSVPRGERSAYQERLAWLRSIPPDPYQTAVEAVMRAKSAAEIPEIATRFSLIRSRAFHELLSRVITDVPPDPPIAERQRWLEALGADQVEKLNESAWDSIRDGQWEAALSKADQVVALDPARRVSMLRGMALANLDRHEEAISEFTRTLAHHESSDVLERRGKSYFTSDRNIEAIKDFTRALELEPGHFRSLLGRAMAYSKIENYPAAIEDLEKACAVRNDDDQFPVFALASSALAGGRLQLALRTLDSIPEWSPAFREQVEHLRQAIKQMLMGEAEGPKALRVAFDAFSRARNQGELYAALQTHPVLASQEFAASMQEYIESLSDAPARENMQARFASLLNLLNNPAQAAFEAFLAARDLGAMKEALANHPILEDHAFVQHVQDMGQSEGHLEK
jgi:tetratricopeptide (TPR) repeat protein